MIRVLRQEPRKRRIISAVSAAAMTASLSTPEMAARTNRDWSAKVRTSSSGVSPARILGISALTERTTSRVEAIPLFMMVSREPRRPSWRTTFCCGR